MVLHYLILNLVLLVWLMADSQIGRSVGQQHLDIVQHLIPIAMDSLMEYCEKCAMNRLLMADVIVRNLNQTK